MKNLLKHKKYKDVLLDIKPDRRLLSKVPDAEGARLNKERRGFDTDNSEYDIKTLMDQEHSGTRYLVAYDVVVEICGEDKKKRHCKAVGRDISSTGMLLELEAVDAEVLGHAFAIFVAVGQKKHRVHIALFRCSPQAVQRHGGVDRALWLVGAQFGMGSAHECNRQYHGRNQRFHERVTR